MTAIVQLHDLALPRTGDKLGWLADVEPAPVASSKLERRDAVDRLQRERGSLPAVHARCLEDRDKPEPGDERKCRGIRLRHVDEDRRTVCLSRGGAKEGFRNLYGLGKEWPDLESGPGRREGPRSHAARRRRRLQMTYGSRAPTRTSERRPDLPERIGDHMR